MEKEENQNLVRFQKAIGIRRDELKHLKKDNLKRDENGYLCVEVLKGKGGKYQLQRIAPENEELVKSYFDGSKDKVFTKEQMDNKIDLHSLRSANAREKYDYYLKMSQNTENNGERNVSIDLMRDIKEMRIITAKEKGLYGIWMKAGRML